MKEISPVFAKKIIYTLGASGTPPEFGVQYFTVGLARYIKAIEEEYLDGVIKEGLSAFKLVVGSYGGGKTHFLYVIRDLAWKHGYATSYIPLNPTECPFNRLELVYREMVSNLSYPVSTLELERGEERGIEAFIRAWFNEVKENFLRSGKKEEEIPTLLKEYANSFKGIESTSFLNAIKRGFISLLENDEETFTKILQWIKGEGFDVRTYSPFGILERIDKRSAFRMMRSLIQWIRSIGFSGLVILFDEAERASSLATSKERRQALDNLRQIVDETSNVRLSSVMFFYAIPDDRQLLEGKEDIYEALRQRLRGVFSLVNPSGVKINLEELDLEPVEFLVELGGKLSHLFEKAYGIEFDEETIDETIRNMANAAYEERYADISYRRLFVKGFIEALHRLKESPKSPVGREEAQEIIRRGLISLERKEIEEIEGREF